MTRLTVLSVMVLVATLATVIAVTNGITEASYLFIAFLVVVSLGLDVGHVRNRRRR